MESSSCLSRLSIIKDAERAIRSATRLIRVPKFREFSGLDHSIDRLQVLDAGQVVLGLHEVVKGDGGVVAWVTILEPKITLRETAWQLLTD